MNEQTQVDILNELLALEEECLPDRLVESTLFISRLAVEDAQTVQDMVAVSREHAAGLSELIDQLDGTPGPRIVFADSADLHYQELHFVLPRLLREHEALIRKYESAARQLPPDTSAFALVDRILRRHKDSLEKLRKLGEKVESAG